MAAVVEVELVVVVDVVAAEEVLCIVNTSKRVQEEGNDRVSS